MAKPDHQLIEMTLDGEFAARRPPPSRPPVAARIFAWAFVAALVGAAFMVAGLVFSLVMMVLPFVVGAGVIAYLAYRYQTWRMRQSVMNRHGPGDW